MKEIFDSYIENAFGGYVQAEFKFRQFEINYKKFFPANKDAAILDIGIGRGEMLTCMKNWRYKNYLGIDISPSTVEFCKSLGLKCRLVDDTAGWLQDNQEKFELITLLDVLEHIKKENTIHFLKCLKASLNNKGLLIVQVPNLQAPDGQLHRYNDFTHEVGYIEHSLQQVLLTAGFKDIRFYGFEELTEDNFHKLLTKFLRVLFWRYVRFTRTITGALNPSILNPVFFAVVRKSDNL
jgi:2-polyprenyl-3-methyl-5-hydroxy-6-metoxy-1,4-benzoquinol methylase